MRIHRTFPLSLWLGLQLLPGLAEAQSEAPAQKVQAPAPGAAQSPAPAIPGPDPAAGDQPIRDLVHRYRFVESYAGRNGVAGPGVIDVYRVTSHETTKESGEAVEAEDRAETVRDAEYVERAAEVSGLGGVSATIRTYSRYTSQPAESTEGGAGRFLEGLTVWYHPQRNAAPQLISMDGRQLREREYEVAARQVYLPALAGLLPAQAARIGDSWRIPRRAVQALLAEPEVRGDALRGKFVELRRAPNAAGVLRAIITVSGTIQGQIAETLVNAELAFDFPAPRPEAADPARKAATGRGDDSLVEARGAIVAVRLARVAQGALVSSTDPKPRPFRVDQQLVLDRSLGGAGPLVRGEMPASAPAATVENSWLTFIDPQGRFTFRHPQDLLPPPRGQASINALFLTRSSTDGRERDLLQIEVFPEKREPEALKASLKARWEQTKAEVLPGGEEWLPRAEWPGAAGAFRLEAALKSASRSPQAPRVHFDAYLLQFGDRASLFAIATTSKDSVPAFRREIEQILKTFRVLTGG